MQFGVDKCAYIHIINGKQVNTNNVLSVNGLDIQPIADGDTYRYLGQDENIGYDGVINKERVRKELFLRCKKIWNSELSATHKATAHNVFAISMLLPTFGIIDWTIEELKDIDIKIRKILSMSGNFHPNSDVDRLYVPRFKNGRGLKSVQTAFECRIVSLSKHLERNKDRNELMNFVYNSELENSIRVGTSL